MLGNPVDQFFVAVDDIVIGHISGELVDSSVDLLVDGTFTVTSQDIKVSLLCLRIDDSLQSSSQIALTNFRLVSKSCQTVNGNVNVINTDITVNSALLDEDIGDLVDKSQQSAVNLDAFQRIGLTTSCNETFDLIGQSRQVFLQCIVTLNLLSQSLKSSKFCQLGSIICHFEFPPYIFTDMDLLCTKYFVQHFCNFSIRCN